MKLFPSRSQWSKWSLPSKAGYVGAWIGAIALLIAILIPLYQAIYTNERKRPSISIVSLDSYVSEESIETKFIIKNVGSKPAFILVKGEAFIAGTRIEVKDEKSETHFQVVMPDQSVKYRGLTIRENTFKMILNGKLAGEIRQTIKISYGATEKTIGEYHTFQSVKLDQNKFAKFRERSHISDGLWLLEKSTFN